MQRFHFELLLVAALCVPLGCCRPAATPAVTARGATGAEDTASVSIPGVTLKAGETLLVSTNDEANDAAVTWNGASMHEDITAHGSNSGCYTKLFSLYSASGGTGEIMASHVSGGDLSMNAYTVTNLAPSALDKTKAGQGNGTNPASGATPVTTKPNELLWGVMGYASNSAASGRVERRVHIRRAVFVLGRHGRDRRRLQDRLFDRRICGGEDRRYQGWLECHHRQLRYSALTMRRRQY